MYGPLRPWACLSRWHPRSSYEGLRSKLSSLHDAMRSIFIATRCQKEDRRSRRKARHEKERSCPSVRGEPLFSQALREEVSPRKDTFARQSTRQTPEDRRASQETARSRP